MAIDAAEAVRIALDAKGPACFVKALKKGDEHWFAGCALKRNGLPVPGEGAMTIRIDNGEVGLTPALPYYVLNREPLPIEIERENAENVPVPSLEN